MFVVLMTYKNILQITPNSAYNEVAFNKKSAITKENHHTKYTPFTYNDVALNRVECIMIEVKC